jgi:hypothetical protein
MATIATQKNPNTLHVVNCSQQKRSSVQQKTLQRIQFTAVFFVIRFYFCIWRHK